MASTVTVRCSELWYEDGNVVFDAQGTLFRVYRGILAANSSVFAAMFSFPQPPTDVESYEGCPLIRTSDDPKEFKFFLKAMHDASFYAQDIRNPYPIVFAILRLASKYDVQYLRSRAIHQLSHDFPATLAEFEAIKEGIAPQLLEGYIDEHALADLLREVDALHSLPVVLLEICQSTPSMEHLLGASLSPENKHACVLGLYALKNRVCRFAASPHSVLLEGCTPMQGCRATYEIMSEEIAALNSHLFVLDKDPNWYTTNLDLCEVCANVWVKRIRADEQAVWDELPELFGLPPWDELRAAAP